MDFKSIKYTKAIIAGTVGTVAMTISALIGFPLLGILPIDPVRLLTKIFWNMESLGWISHFAIGIVLALIYALIQKSIPGPSAVRGILFSLIPWIVFQALLLPLLGLPIFMGSMKQVLASIIRHSIYGSILGGLYGESLRKYEA